MKCRKTVGLPSTVVKLNGLEKGVLKRQEVTAGLKDGNNSVLKR
jgi:hypothetical protein